jgi:hypothetical protein
MAQKDQAQLSKDLENLKSKIKVGDRFYHYKHPDQFYHISRWGLSRPRRNLVLSINPNMEIKLPGSDHKTTSLQKSR